MRDCVTQRTVTTYYIRHAGRDVTVAQTVTVLHSDQNAPSEHLLITLGGTLQDLTADEYVRFRKAFEGFNAVRSAAEETVECDDDHSLEANA